MNTIISARRLHALKDKPGLVILDARWDLMQPRWGENAYREAHIPGARYVSLDDDLSSEVGPGTGRHPLPDTESLTACFRRLGVNSESLVVVYDQSNGAFAARAWWLLRWLGHEKTAVLDGGIQAWIAEGLPLETSVSEPAPGSFNGRGDATWLVHVDEILPLLAQGVPLVDARDAERFAGRVEPIDAVAGHIPGARNAAFSGFQDTRSRFLPARELHQRWTEVVGIEADQDWIVMCGSGVTACNLALSSQIGGLAMPKLYAGSWSEWIRDPARPVARD